MYMYIAANNYVDRWIRAELISNANRYILQAIQKLNYSLSCIMLIVLWLHQRSKASVVS